MAEQFDLVVVGGGIAGTALALDLLRHARQRPRIAIIESTPNALESGSGPERVIALSHGSRRYLEQLEVWTEVERRGAAPIRTIRIFEAGNSGMATMQSAEAGIDALGHVAELANILAPLRAGLGDAVQWYCPAKVESVRLQGDRQLLRLQRQGENIEIGAALVVGSDGSHSQIRRAAGIGSRGWDHNRYGLVASVTPEIAHDYNAFECFRPSGPLAFLPLDAQRSSIVWTLKPEEAMRLYTASETTFLAQLARAGGEEIRARLGRFHAVGPRACFPFELRLAARLTAPRLALIGNAAHTLHPLAGQGMNLGLRDVAVLADVLGRALDGNRDPGSTVVLEEYAQRRWPDIAAVASFTEGVNAIYGFSNDLMRLVRASALNGLEQTPPLKRWLLRRAAGIAQLADLHTPSRSMHAQSE